ncbi:hypothetical protein ACLB2K_005214 [Fragaria x ananassa]
MANDRNDVEMDAPQPTRDQPSIYDRLNDLERVTTSEARNGMLVVAALISAATFAAGINPPGGVWQEDDQKNTPPKHFSGKSVLATNSEVYYQVFYFLNAAAFSSANLVIGYLVHKFPYYVEIWGAMFCMSGTYGISTSAVSPHDFNDNIIWFAIAVPYILRITVEVWKKLHWLVAHGPVPLPGPGGFAAS